MPLIERLPELRRARAALVTERQKLREEYIKLVEREGAEPLEPDEKSRIDTLTDGLKAHDDQLRDHETRIARAETALGFEADKAKDTEDGGGAADGGRSDFPGVVRHGALQNRHQRQAEGRVRREDHESAPSLVIGALCRMMAAANGSISDARAIATEVFGERNPVTEVLYGRRSGPGPEGVIRTASGMLAGVGSAGGFIVPPDYVAQLIEILRPMTVVRGSGVRTIEMPRGTMQMPRQTQAATASYGGEVTSIPISNPQVGQLVATYKKLTALTPISNDLLRYSDPSVDALVRDDLAQIIARREDLAFIRGDGTLDSPKGFASFCLASQKITSTPSFTLATAANELGGAINKIESANVPMSSLLWIMAPRVKNYLLNVQNSNGFYVYQEEMTRTKTLLGWPWATTTQIPINLTVGANNDCSEIYIVAMNQGLLFDSMRLELAVSREASYVDTGGNQVNTFQSDQMLIRCIAEHDFLMRHDEAVAMITGCRYAPAIS